MKKYVKKIIVRNINDDSINKKMPKTKNYTNFCISDLKRFEL